MGMKAVFNCLRMYAHTHIYGLPVIHGSRVREFEGRGESQDTTNSIIHLMPVATNENVTRAKEDSYLCALY